MYCRIKSCIDNHVAEVCCLVVRRLTVADILIGMDLIKLFGGVTITDIASISPAFTSANFENGRWTVIGNWKDRRPSFRVLPDHHREAFDEEVKKLVENG